jgi:hypothetical protein
VAARRIGKHPSLTQETQNTSHPAGFASQDDQQMSASRRMPKRAAGMVSMRRFTVLTAILTVAAASFFAGGLLGFKHTPPIKAMVDVIKAAENSFMALRLDELAYRKWSYGRHVSHSTWIDKIHPHVAQTDVASLISIRSPQDATRTRQRLLDLIWKGRGLPTETQPHKVVRGISDGAFEGMRHLDRIDKLEIRMRHGMTARPYLFHPKVRKKGTVIYHQGHYGHFKLGRPVIERFLGEGYLVIGLSMPMLGTNTGPVKDIPRFGHIQYHYHNVLQFFLSDDFSPLTFFLDPIIVATNYLIEQSNEPCVTMTGVSTGGWLTTFAAAVDTRICHSYPVAGSLPAYVRLAPPNIPNIGDYEEMRPEVLAIANVLEFYVLAATGKGRTHKTIYNQFDDCCYRGIGVSTFRDPVKEAVSEAGGGDFDVHIDSTFIGHRISPFATDLILSDLKKKVGLPD